MRTTQGILFLFAFALVACAQSRDPSASSFISMRDHRRLLIVFAPSAANPGFVQQMKELHAHDAAMRERDILVIPVIPGQDSVLPEKEAAGLMSRLHLSSDRFHVVLVGKDGGVKLSSKVPVLIGDLNRLVDSMPMRKQEINERQKLP